MSTSPSPHAGSGPRRSARGLSVVAICLTSLAGATVVAADDRPATPGDLAVPGVESAGSFRQLFGPPSVELAPSVQFSYPEPPRSLYQEQATSSFFQEQQPGPADPPPKHTGFAALVYSTGSDFKAYPRRRSTYVILGIGLAAAGLAHPLDDNVREAFDDSGKGVNRFFVAGKYMGLAVVQAGAAAGTWVVGRYFMKPKQGEGRTNKISHLGFDLLRANILTQALTYGVKYAVRRDRPTGECCSFPSGHASVTFATASVLERHLGYRAAWPTFVIAGYVAASRIQDDRHFLSDVLFGAALGITSGWTVVGRHGREDYALMAVPMYRGAAVSFVWTPGSHASD
jgi:hypothetical protein